MDKISMQEYRSLRKRLADLPDSPGVYIFRDFSGKVLYVGKASSLKKRVRSYFQKKPTLAPRIAKLVESVCDLQIQKTFSEDEALLLESELIKKYRPRYNIAFRDDKSYPLLKLTKERFPRLLLVREKKDSGARYFGPYADATSLRQALQFMRRVFPLRTCRKLPKTPCLEYHIGQCLAPCAGLIDEKTYLRIVNGLIEFLEGKSDSLIKDLKKRMELASRLKRFEEAARIRDEILSLSAAVGPGWKRESEESLAQLQAALKMSSCPKRIEAFDISSIHGSFAVGSMVAFVDARPIKKDYRFFKIRTVSGIDDYQMMREVVRRRYSGSLSSKLPLPDLILIDGGKGHLNAAIQELFSVGISVPAVGIAKKEEKIFLPGQDEPILLLPSSPVLHLIQRLRDEAHRFAVQYHKKLRARPVTSSLLDALEGIGPSRKKKLLLQFGSVNGIRMAKPDEIARVVHISFERAAHLLNKLNMQ
jgi:excinuclease ABC subunit C